MEETISLIIIITIIILALGKHCYNKYDKPSLEYYARLKTLEQNPDLHNKVYLPKSKPNA